jgi:hypothetical protein
MDGTIGATPPAASGGPLGAESPVEHCAAGERVIMGQRDIVAFLASRGVETLADWNPGEPVLYVIEDALRTDTGHYRDLPRGLRPSFARLDNPDRVDARGRAVDKDGLWTQIFEIVNERGGRVDYYAIDPDTHAVAFVRSSATKRDKHCPYVARGDLLFRARDGLFGKS